MEKAAPRKKEVLLAIAAAPFLCGLLLALGGCTPERRYEVLSIFFDGVPRPGEEGKKAGKVSPQFIQDRSTGPSKVEGYFHLPYLKNDCGQCHPKDRSLFLAEATKKKLCGQCHEHDAFKARLAGLEYLHGPAAVDRCEACHDPHESLYPHLLTAPDPKLCYFCHDREPTVTSAAHREMGEEKCLRCHDPHGGKDRYFLKEARS